MVLSGDFVKAGKKELWSNGQTYTERNKKPRQERRGNLPGQKEEMIKKCQLVALGFVFLLPDVVICFLLCLYRARNKIIF